METRILGICELGTQEVGNLRINKVETRAHAKKTKVYKKGKNQ